MSETREINLITAAPENGMLRLNIVVDGRTEVYVIPRHAAAGAIGRIAEALAKQG